MAAPNQKLEAALQALQALQRRGCVAIRSTDLSRVHRERLAKTGFLKNVTKGWSISSWPGESPAEATAWHAAFWKFCAQYLEARFGDQWSLSPEHSLIIHAGNRAVSTQLLVRAKAAQNRRAPLPHNTCIYETRARHAVDGQAETIDGLRLFRLEDALALARPAFFKTWPTDARALLKSAPDASRILARLLAGGHAAAAGRIAGAFRNIGRDRLADQILSAMRAAMHDIRETDPFADKLPVILPARQASPYAHRLEIMWASMRGGAIDLLPEPRHVSGDVDAYLKEVDTLYVEDAYHSLSIEGYQVSSDLIKRVKRGDWSPNTHEGDREQKNALATLGYWRAFQAVRGSARNVLEGIGAAKVADRDLDAWHRELFAPSIAAGILTPAELVGYRGSPVFIRGSRHAPPSPEAVRDSMPELFRLLEAEDNPCARVVLGHFIFVFIHPFMDGNGRTARFLMNLMLAAADLPWTVIRVEDRKRYMQSLESASVDGDIRPFAAFIGDSIRRAQSQGAAR